MIRSGGPAPIDSRAAMPFARFRDLIAGALRIIRMTNLKSRSSSTTRIVSACPFPLDRPRIAALTSAFEDRQIEPSMREGRDHLDMHDLPAHDRRRRRRVAFRPRPHHAGSSVSPTPVVRLAPAPRKWRHLAAPRTSDGEPIRTASASALENHIWVEQSQQRVESPPRDAARKASTTFSVGCGRSLDVRLRPLPGGEHGSRAVSPRPEALHDGAISSNGMANMSCRTNARRSQARGFRGQQAGRDDRVGEHCLGARVRDGVCQVHAERSHARLARSQYV